MVCCKNGRDMRGSFKGSTAGPTGVCGVDSMGIGAGDRNSSTNKGQPNGLNASKCFSSHSNNPGWL